MVHDPALIVVFAVGAYGFGAAVRGSELVVNELAIVRGAPGTTDGTAQVYLGLFSPTRGVYQVRVPGGALLSAPISGDFFGNTGTANSLDVLQGDPASVRDLGIGFSSLRAIRAQTAVSVPLVKTDLRLEDGRLKGTVANASTRRLERPAVVLGQTVVVLADLEPGASATVDVPMTFNPFGQSLSDKVVGAGLFGDITATAAASQQYVRHNMVDQLTYDPMFGSTNLLSGDGPVVLAWGSRSAPRRRGRGPEAAPSRQRPVLPAGRHDDPRQDHVPRRPAAVHGRRQPTRRCSRKDPSSITFGRGSATLAYRPIAFEGRFAATELAIAHELRRWDAWRESGAGRAGLVHRAAVRTAIDPPSDPASPATGPDCDVAVQDGLADVEVFDLGAQTWKRLPHLASGTRYAVADPAHYVDPTTGTVLIRFVNDRADRSASRSTSP